MRRWTLVSLTAIAYLVFGIGVASAVPGGDIWGDSRSDNPGIAVGGEEGGGGAGVSGASSNAPTTRTIGCSTGTATAACQDAIASCTHGPIPAPPTVAIIEQQQPDGTWRQTRISCNGDGLDDATLAVTAAMVREQVVRLLPPVAVGIAPADGPTLVNLETIFWSPTPATRQLGPVTILGQNVAITIHFDHATYDYGDGTTATLDTPGQPWTEQACDTAQCPTLDGHTYTHPAQTLTTRATVTWTATFTVAGGPTQPIPGTVDGPTSAHDLQVLEGRSVIVR